MFLRHKFLLACVTPAVLALAGACTAQEIIDVKEAAKDPDFAIQGEYVGEGVAEDGARGKVGAQVVALGEGKFDVYVLIGGLPGDGWTPDRDRVRLSAVREGETVRIEGEGAVGEIRGGVMTLQKGDAKAELKRTVRKSPTLGKKPPEGAIVLFDGTSGDAFERARLTEDGAMLSDVTTKQKFEDYHLHLEFRLSWMPKARGQARSNSGVYLHDCYEVQVLDSFGLTGEDNECGGIYKVKKPDVNMCLPPLTWQTYDIDFTAPKYEDGKKTANARLTVRHNGVVIHEDLELPGATPGRQGEGPGPRPFHLQGHGNKVVYGNIWLAPKP